MTNPRHAPGDVSLGLNYQQRERLAALRRRHDQLAARVARPSGGSSRDYAELSALTWVIRVVENAAIAGILKEVE